ncbi:hypothetical protein Hypma_010405 [Hypsizygus marmoreus]|uniref:Uncharacterized protein n=1 Tax=Hypsizygus marmoreus TaxID=39966 RepID=A0A369JKQ7_HYPMA|nr:hypothetical protein Hypma_010405 [Hypsizygus marmoreus]
MVKENPLLQAPNPPTSLRTSSVALAFTVVYDPNDEKAEIPKVLFPALAFDVRGFDPLALGCDCDESHQLISTLRSTVQRKMESFVADPAL